MPTHKVDYREARLTKGARWKGECSVVVWASLGQRSKHRVNIGRRFLLGFPDDGNYSTHIVDYILVHVFLAHVFGAISSLVQCGMSLNEGCISNVV